MSPAHFSFAEVIVPVFVEGTFTYIIPDELKGKLQKGMRVVIPFGGKKLYTGIIKDFHNSPPTLFKAKPIINILEDIPLVTINQLDLWEWTAKYYMCPIGEVYRNTFPSALKLESETFIKLNREIDFSYEELNDTELLIINNLTQKTSLSLKEMEAFIAASKIIPTVKILYEKGLIDIDEKLIEKYIPKTLKYIRLNPQYQSNELEFHKVIENLKNKEKQRELLLKFISLSRKNDAPVEKKIILQDSSPTVLNTLIKNEILQEYELQTDRIGRYGLEVEDINDLSEPQTNAIHAINLGFEENKPVLLHGVTGSGKTEIYIKLIEQQIKNNQSSLFLLPEIAITTLLLKRLQKKFGDNVGYYHSKMSNQERVEVYKNVLNGKYKIIIGARSAVFLPFQNLGLIIVDEEHDSSYKQNEVRPYFNARDTALVLSKLFNSSILLGSATPSLESWENAESGKYKKVELIERYGKTELPKNELIDIRKEMSNNTMKGNFTQVLLDKIQEQLAQNKQVILFQNRRGFAPIMECISCGWTPNCPNCDVSLTYHKISQDLKCHYCGYKIPSPKSCPSCYQNTLSTKGIGTQLIEEELKSLIPTARIERMDVDTMKKKFAYEKLFERFERKEIDILIGTQMVTKGLDFNDVQLVGVIKTDALLNIPNFRSYEKTYQLLSQVSGRAGRREVQGEVILQTYQSDNPFFIKIRDQQTQEIYKELLQERKDFLYPPYTRLIEITLKHQKKERAEKAALYLYNFLNNYIQPPFLLGPEPPAIGRINNQYIYKIFIKILPNQSAKKIKSLLKKGIISLQDYNLFKSVKIIVDVDPL